MNKRSNADGLDIIGDHATSLSDPTVTYAGLSMGVKKKRGGSFLQGGLPAEPEGLLAAFQRRLPKVWPRRVRGREARRCQEGAFSTQQFRVPTLLDLFPGRSGRRKIDRFSPLAVLAQAMLHLRGLRSPPRLDDGQRRPRRQHLLQGVLRRQVWDARLRIRRRSRNTDHGSWSETHS